MIAATIFDLDGTLVETEQLKALSYARAATELVPSGVAEAEVLAAFASLVGRPREEVATRLVAQFGLSAAAATRMDDLAAATPCEAFLTLRLRIYDRMIADPALVQRYQWPQTVQLLREARQLGCRTALATMSYRRQATRVLDILGLHDCFDLIATREDVIHGKPDPEIYSYVARTLAVAPTECLVIEDSLTGVRAALAADMNVIAVTTPITRAQFVGTSILSRCWVVDDPTTLPEVVRQRIAAHQHTAHGGTSWNWA